MTIEIMIRLLKEGIFTSEAIVRDLLRTIAHENRRLNAFVEVFEEEAIAAAKASDLRRKEGRLLSQLDGVPIALKDNIAQKGHVCGCASRMLQNYVSPYDAAVTEKIKAAGMPILGRLNMDEFAMGTTNETSVYGPVRHPRLFTHVAGGSGGGCACAVAAELVPAAIGSDTGGSVRQPAAYCGVVGVKPAYGAISRWGLTAFASSLDQIGVNTKTARDAALLLELLTGADERDRTSNPSLTFRWDDAPILPYTVGIVREAFPHDMNGRVRRGVHEVVEYLRDIGVNVVDVHLPLLPDALAAYAVISSAEAGSNLARYNGVRYGHRASAYADLDELYRRSRSEGFGPEVQRRILLGTFALSEGSMDDYYRRACAVREAFTHQTEEVLTRCDALLMPTAPTPAPRLGEAEQLTPVERFLGDLYTVPANLTGLPAVSLPCGRDRDRLTAGAGLMCRRTELARLLRVCDALERRAPGYV